MKKTILTLLVALSFPAATFANDALQGSMLQVFVTADIPNPGQPWRKYGHYPKSGSGVIIEGNLVLTNAHVVDRGVFIQVKKANDTTKYIATVKAIAHDADLALLRVEDPKFFQDTTPIMLGDLPELRDKVAVYGFPRGESSLSITEGIVSRIDLVSSAHDKSMVLAVQIDASVNGGNSGGPVLAGDRIIGIAFQTMTNQQNTNYAIATPMIRRFLKDIEDGRYDGLTDLGLDIQVVMGSAMKMYYGLDQNAGGYLIREVQSPELRDALKAGDIITAAEGMKIDEEGMITLRKGLRLNMLYLIMEKQRGENLRLTVMRDRASREVTVKLTKTMVELKLVPAALRNKELPYYISGGFVFSTLSDDLIDMEAGSKCKNWKSFPDLMLSEHLRGIPTDTEREVVVLTSILPDRVNTGYEVNQPMVVKSINGKHVTSLDDVVRGMEDGSWKFLVIETSGMQVVLDADAVRERNPVILSNYGIPKDRSDGLTGTRTEQAALKGSR